MLYSSYLIVAIFTCFGSSIFAFYEMVFILSKSYEILLLKINLYDPKITNKGIQINETIKFFLYFCLFALSLNPIKIDKIPIGINNNITHEYLTIPAILNISASPILHTKAKDNSGEIKVNQNIIFENIISFFIFSTFLFM